MANNRQHSALLVVLWLVILAGSKVGPSFAEGADKRLSDLLAGTGLRFVQPDENGVAGVLFRGESIPTIELMIGISGKVPLETVLIAIEVGRCPDRGWDPKIPVYLLRKNSVLVRGHFALSSDGQTLYYMDTPPLQGLSSQTLARLLEFAAIVVDDTYREVKDDLRSADPRGETKQ